MHWIRLKKLFIIQTFRVLTCEDIHGILFLDHFSRLKLFSAVITHAAFFHCPSCCDERQDAGEPPSFQGLIRIKVKFDNTALQ